MVKSKKSLEEQIQVGDLYKSLSNCDQHYRLSPNYAMKADEQSVGTFFHPYIGLHYEYGIRGKRILVLGASFYCNHPTCRFYYKCTDTERKDSSTFDAVCPFYVKQGIKLHDTPTESISEQYKAYSTFADYLKTLIPCETYQEAWDSVAFTNYVQFFLPAQEGKSRATNFSDLSYRDFNSFIELTRELRPDIVVIWGCVINSALKENNPYLDDAGELKETNWYVCHMVHPFTHERIALINSYHPSSSAWYTGIEDFDKYMRKLLQK